MLNFDDDLSHQPKMASETIHYDSDLLDDIFAPATTTERSIKFKPKPRIINKKNLPKSSKSGASEDPSSSSKFTDTTDSKWPVEGSSVSSLGSPCSSEFSITPPVQNPEGNIEYSKSSNVLDTVSQMVLEEPKQCTDMPECLESVDDFNKSSSVSETRHSDSDLVDIFAPATASERTTKFKPKPRIVNQKLLPKPSKSGVSEGPSPSTKFPNAADCKGPVEGSSGPCLGLIYSSVSSSAHVVVQNPEENVENSISNNVLDTVSRMAVGESKKCTDIPCRLETLDGCNRNFTVSEPVNPVHGGSGAVDVLMKGFDSLAEKSLSELHDSVNPPAILNLAVPVESAQETTALSNVGAPDDSVSIVNAGYGAARPIFTSNLDSNDCEPISVSPELEMTQSSVVAKGFAANVEASHLCQNVANLDRDYIETSTVDTSAEPADLFLQSDQTAVKQIGKFRPKSALRVKEGKKTKFVSFVLPTDGDKSSASVECKTELVASNPIERITSIVETTSNENMDESLGSLSTCKKDNQVDHDVIGMSSLDTLDILSEPTCNSAELVEKFKTDIKDRTKRAETISGNSPGLIDFDSDSLHVQSLATCIAPISQADIASGYSQLDSLPIHSEPLDAHGTEFLSNELIEPLAMMEHIDLLTKSSEDRACVNNFNDLVDHSLVENEDLCNMEREHTIDHIEEPTLKEHAASIVQNYEDEKSSRRHRKTKLKCSIIDNMVSEDQNSKDTMLVMDEDYRGECYEDMPEKKKMKATRKSSSRSSEKKGSIRKSKKASGKPDSIVKDPPKKRLPHGSRSKSSKRQVNKALLEIPDEELDRKQLAIRDLIRLAGFKERISNKEASALKNPFSNQREEHEQDPDADGEIRDFQKEGPRLNYHSYMTRPQRTRWSNTETELFYQAIGQFGTDFAMIQVLFPNRSREQVKAKFKNEQRKRPLQIADAAVYRSKDHSHFEKVIQHLQEVAEQNAKDNPGDSSINSQEETDQNEEKEGVEANSKEEQNANFF